MTALAAGASGCLGFLTGEEAYEQEASPARVAEATLDDTGYDLVETGEEPIEREFEVADRTREVTAVNRVAQYHRGIELPTFGTVEAAVFAVVATPAFEIAGQTLNPVGDMDNEELAEMLQDEYDELEVGAEVDAASVATLGDTMSLSQFEGTATFQGEDVDVSIHVGSVRSGDDFVLVVAVHPESFPGEADTVGDLVRGLTHGGE